MTPLADLHIHSVYSDGTLTPQELAKIFAKHNASIVSLTDHDTVAGVEEMTESCKRLGLINIPGIEISTFDKVEIHILGYNMDMSNNSFVKFMEVLGKKRHERILRILDKLKAHCIDISYERVLGYSTASLSRFHIAKVMAESGYGGGTIQGCFNRYLAYGRSCFVPHFISEPEHAIEVIRKAGGIAVFAHPIRTELSKSQTEDLIKRLIRHGLDGIEAEYRGNKELVKFAEDNNLLITAGGDFHTHNSVPHLRPMREKLKERLQL